MKHGSLLRHSIDGLSPFPRNGGVLKKNTDISCLGNSRKALLEQRLRITAIPSQRHTVSTTTAPPSHAAAGTAFGWADDSQDFDGRARLTGLGDLLLDSGVHDDSAVVGFKDTLFGPGFWDNEATLKRRLSDSVDAQEWSGSEDQHSFISLDEESGWRFLQEQDSSMPADYLEGRPFRAPLTEDATEIARNRLGEIAGAPAAGSSPEEELSYGVRNKSSQLKKSKSKMSSVVPVGAEGKSLSERGGNMVGRSKKLKSEESRRLEERRRASCFKLLGLQKDASLEEIRQAYRSLSRKFHPDVNKDPDAAAVFLVVQQAYKVVLSTWQKRQEKEHELRERGGRSPLRQENVLPHGAADRGIVSQKQEGQAPLKPGGKKGGQKKVRDSFWDDLFPTNDTRHYRDGGKDREIVQ